MSTFARLIPSVRRATALAALALALACSGGGGGSSPSDVAPTFTADPVSRTVASGDVVSFTTAAAGTPAPALRWQRDDGAGWADLPGATGTTLSITAAAGDDGTRFRAVASNSAGTAESAPATLTVTYLLLVVQPFDQLAETPAAAAFSALAQGNPVPTYQWQRSDDDGESWTSIPDATGTTYTLDPTAPADDGARFRVLAANGVSADVASTAAILTVHQAAAITVPPSAVTVAAGASATFTVEATGNPTPTLQWERSADGETWTEIPGATGAGYTLHPATVADDGARFRAVATNGVSAPATSAAVALTVTHLQIVAGPAASTVVSPAAATFAASAVGTPAPTYQWQRSDDGGDTWSDLAGATGTSFTTGPTALADDGARFRVRVANGVSADVASAAAALTVHQAPLITAQPAARVVSEGDEVSFTVAATANPAPTYRWERSDDGASWSTVAGATGATCTLTAALADDGARFRVVLDNGIGAAVESGAAQLGVRPLLLGHWERIADGPPVSHAAVAYDPVLERAVLFGGSDVPAPSERTVGDTWIWDSATLGWTQAAPAGDVPSPRLAAGMAFDEARGEAVLTGGWFTPDFADPGHPPAGPGLGTYAFDLATETWTFRGDARVPVDCFAIGYDTDAGRVRMFGGQTVVLDPADPDYQLSRYYDRVWTWDPDTEEWPGIPIPEGVGVRSGPRWAYDSSQHRFVLFGGGHPGWCGVFPCEYHQDTWEYDPGTAVWQRTTQGDLQPPPSGFFGMAYDPVRQRTVMYLGMADGLHGLADPAPAPETWEYDAAASTWRRYAAAGEPGNLDIPTLFFDTRLGAVLLVGGGTAGGMSAGTYRFVPDPAP